MTNQYLWERLAGRDPNLRAGDADRERTADRLRKSHTEGRLDIDEFQQRLDRCYAAKTFGELGELVRDLPRQDELDERASSRGRLLPRRALVAPLAWILVVLIVLSAAVGHHHVGLWIPLVFLFWRLSWWRRRGSWAGPRRGSRRWY